MFGYGDTLPSEAKTKRTVERKKLNLRYSKAARVRDHLRRDDRE